MATRKDYVAIEQAIASASVSTIAHALEHQEITPTEMALLCNVSYATAIAEELKKANPAFNPELFVQEIERFSKELTDE